MKQHVHHKGVFPLLRDFYIFNIILQKVMSPLFVIKQRTASQEETAHMVTPAASGRAKHHCLRQY